MDVYPCGWLYRNQKGGTGVIDFKNIKGLTIPEGEVAKIDVNGSVLWEKVVAPVYKNWMKYSTESDGVTIYNGGLGYKNGYRLSSSGGESTNTKDTVTGFMPVKGGETIRIKAKDTQGNTVFWYNTALSTNYLNAYKEDKSLLYAGNAKGTYGSSNLIESMIADTENGISIIKLKSVANIAFIRISVAGSTYAVSGVDLIVTIDEEIT